MDEIFPGDFCFCPEEDVLQGDDFKSNNDDCCEGASFLFFIEAGTIQSSVKDENIDLLCSIVVSSPEMYN